MSEFYESIERGLQEAIAFAEGKDVGARVYKPFQVDVKAVRKRIGMTFIKKFHLRVYLSCPEDERIFW